MRVLLEVLRSAVTRRTAVVMPLVAVLALTAAGASAARTHHHARQHQARPHHRRPGRNHRRKHQTSPHPGATSAHGQLLSLRLRGNTTQSNNWFGYNQGALEPGKGMFHSITGQWTVPTATQHTGGQAEASSDWIGIGGGCANTSCTVTDSTLIQTGTEQDVDSSGAASYSAWWEIIPGPSVTITNMTVKPGDLIKASIAEQGVPGSNLWTITLTDGTQTFSQTIPYPSSHLTAEWIEETPLEIGTNAGFSALPNLTNPIFDYGTVNGAPANLNSSEAMELVDSNGHVIGTPSAPDSDADGFGACTWSGTCTAPAS
jgi:hypothetical protein